jgi:hypothetical protein
MDVETMAEGEATGTALPSRRMRAQTARIHAGIDFVRAHRLLVASRYVATATVVSRTATAPP